MADIAFDYPKTFGFTSGWNDGFNPDGSYRLTRRIPVRLQKLPAHSLLTGESRTMLLKTAKKTGFAGLSSGAGSSLYRLADGSVIKIKRNGYFHNGPVNESYCLPDVSFKANLETSKTFFKRGIMDRKTAETEFKMLALLHNEGFCSAVVPQDILIYSLPDSKEEAYAIFCQVTSDLRLDELVFALYSDHLKRQVDSKKLSFNKKNGLFLAKNYSLNDALNEKQLFSDLFIIGKVLGSNYRKFHQAGFLRGYPHSWFGNEVIGKDGSVSFADLEFAYHTVSGKKQFKQLQEIERFQAQSALFSEFETMGLHFFALGAKELAKGFIAGYEKPSVRKIPVSILKRAFVNYEKNKKMLWGEK